MPAVEPSFKAVRNQEQLATILIPIFVMLGAIGLSYGIYTALKWLQPLKRPNDADVTWFDTESEDMSSAVETPQSTSDRAQCFVQKHNDMPTLVPSSSSRLLRPLRSMRLGREAILARKAMKEKQMGHKPHIFGVIPIVTLQVPERAMTINRWHGVGYI